MLHEMLQRLGSHGVMETVIGMAHRGRLNVLVNILGKDPWDLFNEFDGKLPADPVDKGTGDVKYHQGFSTNVMTPGGEMHLALAFNPSHLEIVNPVVEGSVRARQDRRRDYVRRPCGAHHPARRRGFRRTGRGDGNLPDVADPRFQDRRHDSHHHQQSDWLSPPTVRIDARSTEYCTEVAKMVQAPIFHVNADDPEAVLFVTQLAVDYRMEFRKDVVIDLVCYRRRGHNEAEEPMKTQPLMYKKIRSHPTTRSLYVDTLVKEGVVTRDAGGQAGRRSIAATLDDGGHVALSIVQEPNVKLFVDWAPYLGKDWTEPSDTRVPLADIRELSARLEQLPEGFVLQRQVQKIMEDRHKMAAGAMPINWGYAEVMAYATLLHEGHGVRLTGQDVGVGTFSHRHASLYNQKDGKRWIPLNHLRDDVNFDIYDSLLSEEAVLAFEYGYATTAPNTLVVWEAQFGDFANGAQVVIDQFISSGEVKWQRLCGLTMLLPAWL